jgi:2-iminobutanoate/2-iminopropanoate deaminase|tara:strand:- start:62664 stop:63050 length:387 start_codon:yes stop_codon:yes gene_type:complete
MQHRITIPSEGSAHKNPIPAGCRIGNVFMSGLVVGRIPETGEFAEALEDQCALVFENVRKLVETAGGTIDDIIKINLWLRDGTQRGPINKEWQSMFPNEDNRPARQSMQAELTAGALIQADFVAVIHG